MSELTFESTSNFLDTGKGKLHYHVAGDGPPLLLLHGSGPGVSSWANFRGNLPVFARHFTTYMLDMPGFGKTVALANDSQCGLSASVFSRDVDLPLKVFGGPSITSRGQPPPIQVTDRTRWSVNSRTSETRLPRRPLASASSLLLFP